MKLSMLHLLGTSVLLILFFVLGWATGLLGAGPKPKPLTCYFPSQATVELMNGTAITMQFDTQKLNIARIVMFCPPADKTLPPDKKRLPVATGDHLVEYELQGGTTAIRNWKVSDQFDTRTLKLVGDARWLLEPSGQNTGAKETGG